jgi:hypothetical protein
MKIRIISDDRGLFFIDVPEYISVFELKQKLLDEKGIYLGDDPLLCNGNILFDKDILKDYNIKNNDIINIPPHYVAGGPETENKDYSSNINAINKRENIGKEYYYQIIGSEDGTVWGDDIFTDDSNIAKAAVLKGKCKLGEKSIVGIKMIEGKSSYSSSNKNGVSSITYGSWPASYVFL